MQCFISSNNLIKCVHRCPNSSFDHWMSWLWGKMRQLQPQWLKMNELDLLQNTSHQP